MSVMTRVLGILRFGKPRLGCIVPIDSGLPAFLGVIRSLRPGAGGSWASASEASRFADGLRAEKAFNESLTRLPIAR